MLISVMANAQVSVQVGYEVNTMKSKMSAPIKSETTHHYNGIFAAVDYNLSLVDRLSVAPGIGIDFLFSNNYGLKYRELGLHVPIDFNYRFPINDGFSLSVFAGPTFYYGLSSKDLAETPHYNYFGDESKRFDLSLGGGVWCDIVDRIRFKVGYKFGLTNTSKLSDCTDKDNTFYISVGYLF